MTQWLFEYLQIQDVQTWIVYWFKKFKQTFFIGKLRRQCFEESCVHTLGTNCPKEVKERHTEIEKAG